MPGASDFFAGSLVCYTNRWKEQLLGVSRKTLEKHGAVSEETAREMLDGVMARTGAEAGIAVTGIAGPGGGTAEKPVGLVYIAAGVKECRQVVRYIFPGTRENVRERTIAAALNQLRLILQKETGERSH
jgi:PncC family amidohydrolase